MSTWPSVLASHRDSSSAAGWNPGLRFEDFLPGMVRDMRRSKKASLIDQLHKPAGCQEPKMKTHSNTHSQHIPNSTA
jgi:hypothetical protein